MDQYTSPFCFSSPEKYSEQCYAINRPTIVQVAPVGKPVLSSLLTGWRSSSPSHRECCSDPQRRQAAWPWWPLSNKRGTADTGEGLAFTWRDSAYRCLALSTPSAQMVPTLHPHLVGWIPGLLRTVKMVLKIPPFSQISCCPSSLGASPGEQLSPASLNLTPPWKLTPFYITSYLRHFLPLDKAKASQMMVVIKHGIHTWCFHSWCETSQDSSIAVSRSLK